MIPHEALKTLYDSKLIEKTHAVVREERA